MALPVPDAGRQGLVTFRLFGFPVTIHASFLLIVLFFGLSGRNGLAGAVVWLVVVTVSVIAHELGHAAVAAPCGGEPRIDLYGMAGLTRWQPGNAGRGRRVAVSLAGPGAGVLFGLLVLVVYLYVDPERGTLMDFALESAVFANMLWGLVNLLPMLPLDGGQVVYALMPGRDDGVRLKRAAYLSLGVAAVTAVAVFTRGQPILAAFVVFFAAGNVQTITALRRADRPDPLATALRDAEAALVEGRPDEALRLLPHEAATPQQIRDAVTTLRAMALLRADRAREAQDLLNDAGGRVEPTFAATVLLANGQERLARERLDATLRQDPREWAVRELVALLVRRGEDVDEVLGEVGAAAASGASAALHHAGDHEAAARWGDRAILAGAGALAAYNTACSWARAGDPGRALRALDHAALMGWTDLEHVEDDADLAPVRALPGYPAVRDRIAANAGLGHPSHHG